MPQVGDLSVRRGRLALGGSQAANLGHSSVGSPLYITSSAQPPEALAAGRHILTITLRKHLQGRTTILQPYGRMKTDSVTLFDACALQVNLR